MATCPTVKGSSGSTSRPLSPKKAAFPRMRTDGANPSRLRCPELKVTKPIQILAIVIRCSVQEPHRPQCEQLFYERVSQTRLVLSRCLPASAAVNHHINTQASMWYRCEWAAGRPIMAGDFRLNFQPTHDHLQLMTEQGCRRWNQTECWKRWTPPAAAHDDDPRSQTCLSTLSKLFHGKVRSGVSRRETRGVSATPIHRSGAKINFNEHDAQRRSRLLGEAEL